MIHAIIFIIIGVVIDQILKHIIGSHFEYDINTSGTDVIGDLFRITYRENTGVVWGLGGNESWLRPVLIVISIVALGFFIYLLIKYYDFQNHKFFSIAIILLISGTIGNLIDRVFLGYVIDYIEVGLFNFAIFNFADSCLTIGTIILLIDILFGKSGEFLK
ncbi:MAG TPA: signal peptidase II [Acholeplasmataceae bacterium]|nr:signal peptidase II [Acholeplasmataceae bacterium]